jgi:hypothetical protein
MALTPIRRMALAAALAVPLAACGTGSDDPLVQAVQGVTGGLLGGGDDAATAPVFTAETVPPELVAQQPGPLMLVEVQEPNRSSGMTRVGRNGPDETWRGPNGIGLTVDAAGVLRSTRGFGFDLMSSDVRPTSAALERGGTRQVDRAMIHLDGNVQQLRRVYRCEIRTDGPDTRTIAGRAVTLTRMTERCTGQDGYVFENAYWLDRSGRAVQSRQWISPEIGHLRVTILSE